ncbi:MAG: DUF456 domain-containing protein [Candidatus Krumholzibacteria bacterium]|nr:DUF456 domain-containing protein [Candidatus Krumholzibacteria bacterium]
MVSILQHAGLVLLYVLVFFLDALIFAGLPGSWIALGVIVVYDLARGFGAVGWPWLVAMAALAVIGEIIESTLGVVVVARKGASKWGVAGAFVGGIVGAIAGTAVIPVVGSVIFALAGAFAGAVAGEYYAWSSMDRAMRTGFWAFIGKLQAMFVKYALGLAILVLFIYRSWR